MGDRHAGVQEPPPLAERARILDGVLASIDLRSDANAAQAAAETIQRLSHAVTVRDEETGRHIERMSRYAVVIAQAVGYDAMPFDELRLATALHDVGKIGVSDSILLKPGPLTADEYATMQRHASIGHQMLAGSASHLLRVAAVIAHMHHEWWDGGGYPQGLRGEEIPLEARIAAVADVFDALTSHRVYRPALSFDEALEIMGRLRGRQFEPRLLDALVDEMDAITEIREAFPEVDPEGRISVLVVDDHEIFAQSLVRLLAPVPRVRVVGTANSVASAVEAARGYEPDVVLMDFELPDGEGPDAIEQIKQHRPETKVVMLTSRSDHHARVRAIAAGCAGFVRKDQAVDVLLRAILAVAEGEALEPPSDLPQLMAELPPTDRGLAAALTGSEVEVIRLIEAGLLNRQIAERLQVDEEDVRARVQAIFTKLHASTKFEVVAIATREGIIG